MFLGEKQSPWRRKVSGAFIMLKHYPTLVVVFIINIVIIVHIVVILKGI